MVFIGQDNRPLIVPREIRSRVKNGPAASRTEVGWVLYGVGGGQGALINCLMATCKDEIEDTIRNYLDFDGLGVQPKCSAHDVEQCRPTRLQHFGSNR
ncbi:hypothetical protein EVAR_23902_1 [Eumeta japonica]|uniref:Uncharacterized protein n=1 Tax=Eumeta variegata TaxID=151549 RepID=A0A4C1V4H9_EUMVA|nr:hypothetical protein EVAR_23902_1 [Eumeta japonica]